LPDVLDRVEFWAFGRQDDDADIARLVELAGGVPPVWSISTTAWARMLDSVADLPLVEIAAPR